MANSWVDPRMWDDDKFVALDDLARTVWMYLLTGPEATQSCPGLIILGTAGLAEAMRRSTLDIANALQRLERAGMVEVDAANRVIRVPKAPMYRAPGNANVVRGWHRRWTSIPSAELRERHVVALVEAWRQLDISDGTRQAIEQTFGRERRRRRQASAETPQQDLFQQVQRTVVEQDNDSDDIADVVSLDERRRDLSPGVSNDSQTIRDENHQSCRVPADRDAHEHQVDHGFPNGSRMVDQTPRQTPSQDQDRRSGQPAHAHHRPSEDDIARELWAHQERHRADLGLPPLAYRAGPVMAALRQYKPSQLQHALDVFHADACRVPEKAMYFNGTTNWSANALQHAVGMPVRSSGGSGSRPVLTGTERYAGGMVIG